MTLYAAFILGFAGSFHCVAMCGALTLAVASSRGGRIGTYLTGKTLYNLGRTFTYTVLGLLLGASKLLFGAMLFDIHHAQEWLSISIGASMLLAVVLPRIFTKKVSVIPIIARFVRNIQAPVQTKMGKMLHSQNFGGQFLLGMMNGLLPCGFVYVALAMAALQPTLPLAGLSMTMFGLGTIPAMLGVVIFARVSGQKFRFVSRFQRFAPAATALLAVLFILRGLSLGIPYISPQLSAAPAGLEKGCHVPAKNTTSTSSSSTLGEKEQ